MNCQQLTDKIDDYMDGALPPDVTASLDQHVAACTSCRQLVAREKRLSAALRDYRDSSVPAPASAFFDQSLARADRLAGRRQQKQWWLKGFGSAAAAGLAVWIIAGTLLTSPDIDRIDAPVPTVTMALEEPRTIRLVFSSESELTDATLTVNLPEGIELAGFEGQREISWMTSLKAGRNLLPLKLIATSPLGGELLATLQHRDDDKTFRLQVTVI